MRQSGELVQWNNKGGYGFVRDDAGRDYYVHISKVGGDGRPRIGDRMEFAVGRGRNGRPSAIDVSIAVPAANPPGRTGLREARRGSANVSPFKLGLRIASATMLTMLIILAIGLGRMPAWIGLVYAAMGIASALFYRFDKLYALNGQYRVSEANLHLVDLAFGIVGGLIAQEVYRHKTIKPRFVATTWVIAILHTLGLTALTFLSLPGL